MKRPTKQKKQIRKENYDFESYLPYTSDALRAIADMMDDKGILSIEFEIEGYDGYFKCTETSIETDAEFEKRYKREYDKWKKWKEGQAERKEKEKNDLIKAAKKLGMKLVEEKQ